MRNEALCSALGLAQRAGKIAAGDFACEKAVKSGKALLVTVDASASEATRLRYEGMCARGGIPCLCVEDMDAAIGRYGRKVAAITDGGFARMILQKTHGGVD